MNQYLFLRQQYTSSQLMGSPAPMGREFVRMGRVIKRPLFFFFVPQFTTTGLGIRGFRPPIRLIEGTCLNFFVSIVIMFIDSWDFLFPLSYMGVESWKPYSSVIRFISWLSAPFWIHSRIAFLYSRTWSIIFLFFPSFVIIIFLFSLYSFAKLRNNFKTPNEGGTFSCPLPSYLSFWGPAERKEIAEII